MKLLYDDAFAPITTSIGFLAADLEQIASTYFTWMSEVQEKFGRKLTRQKLSGPLDNALARLLPLTIPGIRRALFAPTDSRWVAYFDNSGLGTDEASLAHMSRLLKCRAVRITAISREREHSRTTGAREPAVMLTLYEAHETDWLNYLRTVVMAKDGQWIFEARGQVQPFEELDRYTLPKIQDRFTVEMLDRYLGALDIRAFDPAFYMFPGKDAILFEQEGPPAKNMREYTLEQIFTRFE